MLIMLNAYICVCTHTHTQEKANQEQKNQTGYKSK